ncbi:Aste57867_14088 [Aphanomyces stellatus]|uniref:Aste57867_14088 protein n=1 Tax=Aphanomyces stellatus TaxID=120398 RepID=A0A485L0F9_9STRA|nr:hypothetical protein As57867_014037 [Aphanomyces stellatus]VFT90916.1 Aste57867_14088 [Aphanomyces stellatus]
MPAHDIDEKSSYGTLIATAIGFGVFHVMSGPDHLSALATLSAGSSWRSFALGVRWGCGHSIGLILMAVIFILLDDSLNLEKLDMVTEIIVGVFMIALGVYGLHSAFKKLHAPFDDQDRDTSKAYDQVPFDDERSVVTMSSSSGASTPSTRRPSASPLVRDPSPEKAPSPSVSPRKDDESSDGGDLEDLDLDTVADALEAHMDAREDQVQPYSRWAWVQERSRRYLPRVDMENPTTQKATALCVGIIHGIAGPGGILGVMPAVRYHNWIRSMLYLGTFCVTSIVIMGLFAALYGELTARLGQRSAVIAFRINVFSSSLSVAVGILWITLVALGKMKAVFG